MTRDDDLTRAARQATLAQLNEMLRSNEADVRASAADEQLRRAEERRTQGSLTGVVRPIEET